MTAGKISIRPTDGGAGAFVEAIDVRTLDDDAEISTLRQALGEYGVLFFRDQQLSPQDHIAFAKRFGEINVNRFFAKTESFPEIAEVRKEPHHKSNIGQTWHTDHSYDNIPALGSILLAQETPSQGGDTAFANMYSVYNGLSDGLKATLESLRAVHSSRHVFGPGGAVARSADLQDRIANEDEAVQDATHPVVIKHPISGKKALFVNPQFTVRFEGWTAEESRPLIAYLGEQADKPENNYRFQWRPGSLAFWDNRATWHLAFNDYPGERRLMHRITLEGEPLSA
ncbi:MAG: TauD/TfdA family dioxygenase [Pseudomonadota bacterium]